MSTHPAQPQQPFPPQQYARPTSSEDRTAAVLAHVSALIAAALSAGTLTMLGPLVVWLIYKDKSPFVRQAAAGAFNFNLTFWVLYVLSWILIFTLIGAVVGVPLLLAIFVVSAYCHIKGAIRANRGEHYDYPFQIRVLS